MQDQRVTLDWQQNNPLVNFTGGGGRINVLQHDTRGPGAIRMPMPQGGWGGSSIDSMYPMLPNNLVASASNLVALAKGLVA